MPVPSLQNMQTGELIISLRTKSDKLKHGDILHCQKASVVRSDPETGIQIGEIGPDEPHLMCETHRRVIHSPIYHIENALILTDNKKLVEASKIKSEIDEVRLNKDDIKIGSRYRFYTGNEDSTHWNRHKTSIWDAIDTESSKYDVALYSRKKVEVKNRIYPDEIYLYDKNEAVDASSLVCDPGKHEFKHPPQKSAPWMKPKKPPAYEECKKCEARVDKLQQKYSHDITVEKRSYNEYIIACRHTFPFTDFAGQPVDNKNDICNWIALASPSAIKHCFGDDNGFNEYTPDPANPCPNCEANSNLTFEIYHLESDLCKAIRNVLLKNEYGISGLNMDPIFNDEHSDRILTSEEIQEIRSEYSDIH
jgi:hypothetical protein